MEDNSKTVKELKDKVQKFCEERMWLYFQKEGWRILCGSSPY
jgi:hypothetical protein